MDPYVYHGSFQEGLKVLEPRRSTHLKEYVYATENPVIALVFATHNHGDLDFSLTLENGQVIFTERRLGVFDSYHTSGYLYTLDSTHFKHLDSIWGGEVVSFQKEEVISYEYIEDIMAKLEEYAKEGKLTIYRYPEKPDFIPKDDSDLVDKYIHYEKMGHRGSIDEFLQFFPSLKEMVFHKLEMPKEFYYLSKNQNIIDEAIAYDTIVDAILNSDDSVFVREDGWLNYHIMDSKFVFEKGGFCLDKEFYLYRLQGNSDRLSAHSFHLNKVEIISCEAIDLKKYLALEY